MKRAFLTGAIALLAISNSTVLSLADEVTLEDNNIVIEDTIPRYQYISSARSNISIDSKGVATISCTALGISGVKKIEITAYLQQYKNGNWVNVASWSGSGTDNCLVSKTKSVSKGYSYRVSSKITAYKGSLSENITVNSNTVTY